MLCLGCFDSDKPMKNLKNELLLSHYLLETLDIRVCDGLRPWRFLCWECEALLFKFVEFRRRVKRLFSSIEGHVQKKKSIKSEINIKLELEQENETPAKIDEDIAVFQSDTDENSEDSSHDDNFRLSDDNNIEVYSDFEKSDDELSNHINFKILEENSMKLYSDFNKTGNETNIEDLNENSIKEYHGRGEHNDELNERNVNHSNNSNNITNHLSKIVLKRTLEEEIIKHTNRKVLRAEKVYKFSPTKQRILEQKLMRSVLEREGKKKNPPKQKELIKGSLPILKADMALHIPKGDMKRSFYPLPRREFRTEVDPTKIKTVIMNIDEQRKLLEERLNSEEFKSLPHGCNLCGRAYKDEIKLEQHMVLHDKTSGDWECALCHMYIPTKHKFNRHMKAHELFYECLTCGYTTCWRSSINQHYSSAHENGISLQCQYCPRIYKYRGAFLEHEKTHVSEPEVTCETCGKIFHNDYALRKHKVYHTQVKAFACDKCDKKFLKDSQLQAHKVLHSEENTFYCNLCDATFKKKANYKNHMKYTLKHVDPETLRYKCSLCPRRFQHPAMLHNHELGHAGKPHSCNICDRSFFERSSLRLHIRRIHQGYKGEKKYMCDKCGKSFEEGSSLKGHLQTHTGERPYVCSLCDRAFTQSSSLLTHHKLVHLKIKTAQSFQRKNKKVKT